ncbi:MAG: transaldolase family protein [Candidatus Omnitrophica bacterium]|nr:transaldolase family protein [Candidatus Omnitrophota bacterium]
MPKPKIYQYGYDINEVEKQIYTPQREETAGGYFCRAVDSERYGLYQAFIKKGSVFPLGPENFPDREVLIYVEGGEVDIKSNNLKPQETLLFRADQLKEPLNIEAKEDSFVYFFSGLPSSDDLRDGILKKSAVFNFRDQYWADVLWTMVNREFCGKKIFFKKGNNSSFHFHCYKQEAYFVHSGKLLLRIRAGKGEDRFFVLHPGQAVNISPGLMHQAGGLEDTVVMEVSTRDNDGDAFLIESEFTKMPKINETEDIIINKDNKNMANKKLKLFLDSTNPEEVEKALQKDILSGISTNPGMVVSEYFDNVRKIAELCKKYKQEIPISVMLTEADPERMAEQAKDLASQINYKNLIIRIPAGWEESRLAKELTEANINVECTLGMNEAHAILAANTGAKYFFIHASNIKDMGVDPFKMVENSRQLLNGFNTEIIVGGIRPKSMRDVVEAFLAGADAISAPLDVLEKMASHPKTTENIIRFVNAYHQWGK